MERDILNELSHSLRLSRRRRQAITRELQTHLVEARRDLELAGWHPDDAARESVARLGDPDEIATEFVRVDRPPRRKTLGLAFGLAGALLVGAYGASGTLASARSAHHETVVQVQKSAHSANRDYRGR
jgi:hypothetical protein